MDQQPTVTCPKCQSKEMRDSRLIESAEALALDPIEFPFPPPESAWIHVCAKCGKRILRPA